MKIQLQMQMQQQQTHKSKSNDKNKHKRLPKTRSQQGREQRRGKQVYKNKTYQNGALTHHLRDALSQLCGHARLIQATREFAFHSRISFAFTVVAVPIVDVVVVLFTTMQGLNDAWGTSCCYCCCLFCHFVCVQKPATNARTQTCKQDAPTALPAALLCFARG